MRTHSNCTTSPNDEVEMVSSMIPSDPEVASEASQLLAPHAHGLHKTGTTRLVHVNHDIGMMREDSNMVFGRSTRVGRRHLRLLALCLILVSLLAIPGVDTRGDKHKQATMVSHTDSLSRSDISTMDKGHWESFFGNLTFLETMGYCRMNIQDSQHPFHMESSWSLTNFAFSGDGSALAAAFSFRCSGYLDMVLVLRRLPNGRDWEMIGRFNGKIEQAQSPLSKNGSILAIKTHDECCSNIYVYQLVERETKKWKLLGRGIDTFPTHGDDVSYSLAASGRVIASSTYPKVYIHRYDWKYHRWLPDEQGLSCENTDRTDYMGKVSISDDGSTVALGVIPDDDLYHDSFACVFKFDSKNRKWLRMGRDVGHDFSGGPSSNFDLALSGDGGTLALVVQNPRSVLVLRFHDDVSQWQRLGADIQTDFDVPSISLSHDGSVIAIQNEVGNTEVLKYDKNLTEWRTILQTPKVCDNQSSFKKESCRSSSRGVGLSADGTSVAVGADFLSTTDQRVDEKANWQSVLQVYDL